MAVNQADLAQLLKESGYAAEGNEVLEKLPKSQKKRLCALKKLQLQSIEVEAKFYERVHQLEKEFEADFNKFFEQRKKVITGEHEPTDAEADVALIHGIEKEALDSIYEKSEEEKGVKGIPGFWLQVLRSSEIIGEMIQEHDIPILNHLVDVTTTVEISPPGFTLYFHFSPNEYFTNAVLKKSYDLQITPDVDDPFEFDGPSVVKAAGDVIQWVEGNNVTKKVVKKKQKKGPNAGKFLTKTIKAESFFNFFEPPQVPVDQNEDEEENPELSELVRADFEIGQVLRDHVIPRAVLFFTGEADLGDDDMFDFGEDDEDMDDEEEDDE